MGLGMLALKKLDWTEVSWQANVDNAKFSVKTRLDHDFPLELTDIE